MPEIDLTIQDAERLSYEQRAAVAAEHSDIDTPERTNTKDQHALEQLFPELIPRVYRFALRLTNNDEHLAEDITQEAFIRAWKKRKRLRTSDPESLRVWLFRTAHNVFIDALRRAERHQRAMEIVLRESSGHSADSESLASDEHQRVQRAMQRLPDRQQEVLHLAACEGLSHQVIAEVLSITPEAVKASLSLARKAIREILNDDQD